MKKKHLIGLCFLIASQVVLLSSCDKTYGYPKDVLDGFYSFDAHFSNGTNKTYKLNKDINAKVIGNCLVCDYKDERLNDFIELLPNFDIICFQEVFTTLNDRKHRMIREGAKVGLKYYVSSKVPSFFSTYISDSGLLILS